MRPHLVSKKHLSLNGLLAALGIGAVLLLLVVYSIFTLIVERGTTAMALADTGRTISARLAAELEYALWDFSYANLTLMLNIEAANPDIRRISLIDNKGKLVMEVVRRNDGQIESSRNQPSQSAERDSDVVGIWTAPIRHFTQTTSEYLDLGHIEVAISDQHRQIDMLSQLARSIFTQLAFSSLTIGFFYFAIQRLIVRRIINLYQVITEVANFSFTSQAKVDRLDEIGRLSQRFNTMAQLIHKYTMEMEAQVKERTAQLVESEKLAFLGGLVAGIAHEINTPVGTSVTAITYLGNRVSEVKAALEQGSLTRGAMDAFLEEVLSSTAIVSSNLNRTSELVQTFRGIGADQMNDEIRVFALRDYINQVIFSLSPALRRNNHKIVVECPDTLLVQGHPSAFYQILSNLIMNSLVHGFPQGGEGIMTVTVKTGDEGLAMDYVDNGAGIPAAAINKIFTPFFTTKRGQGGTGLGLYIVYTLVAKLEGTIACQSVEGQGVRFQILLPKALVVT